MRSNSLSIFLPFICLGLIGTFLLSPAAAQDGKKKMPAKKAEAKKEITANGPKKKAEEKEQATVLKMIRDSGPSGIAFMIVLAIFSLLAVAIVIERLVNLTRGKLVPPEFVEKLRTALRKEEVNLNDLHGLVKNQEAPVAGVLRAGLRRVGRPVPEVEKSMEDTLAREVNTLRGRIRPLNVIGTVAPLIGLLGTVVGMIIAFYNASKHQDSGKAEILGQGIYLALLTTAAGLTIAIPSLLFAAYFGSRIDRYVRDIDEELSATLPFFDNLESTPVQRESYATEFAGAED